MDSKFCLNVPSTLCVLQDELITDRHLYLLRCSGIYTIQKLATQQISRIRLILACEEKLAEYVLSKAYASVPTTWFQTSQELKLSGYKSQKTSFGCEAIDKILGGGVALGEIIEIFGASGTGKSQACMTLAVSVQMPKEHGGLLGKCIFVDTRRTLRPDRILEILNDRIQALSDSSPSTKPCLDNIIVVQPRTSDQLFDAMISIKHYLSTEWYPLLVFDGITSLVRSEYPCNSDVCSRNKVLAKTLSLVKEICEEFQVAVVVTNTSYSSFVIQNTQVPYGGLLMDAFAATRLQLTRDDSVIKSNQRTCSVYQSAHLASKHCKFFISSSGLSDK